MLQESFTNTEIYNDRQRLLDNLPEVINQFIGSSQPGSFDPTRPEKSLRILTTRDPHDPHDLTIVLTRVDPSYL